MEARKTQERRKDHPLYGVWRGMTKRCRTLKSYIVVHHHWVIDYEAFKAWCLANGWRKGLQLVRKDSKDDFCPENCEFVTVAVKAARMVKGLIGVRRCGEMWRASIWHNGKTVHLGSYGTPKHAIQVRDSYILEHGLSHPLQDEGG